MNAFDKIDAILNFGVPRKTEGVEYLLWPVLAYRLTAPLRRVNSQSNPLERALLGLVRSGISDLAKISDLLGLAPELARHIARTLIVDTALDAQMRLTEHGRQLLDEFDDVQSRRAATGWIFQDPWTGELWDKFVLDLPTVPFVVEKELGGRSFPKIDLGTEGKPFNTSPWLIKPKSADVGQPQAADILRSVTLVDERDNEPNDNYAVNAEYGDGSGNRSSSKRGVAEVTYLDAAPEAMYCVTALKVQLNSRNGDAWRIFDPFMPQTESIRMRRALTLRLDAYPFIAERLAKLLGLQNDSQATSFVEFIRGADAAAEMQIQARFGALADKFGMKDRLVELAKKLQIMQAIKEDPEPVLLECGKTVERLMKWLLKEYQARKIADVLNLQRGQKCFKLLNMDVEANIKTLGYSEVPKALLTVDQSKLNHALIKGTGSLMPLTLAAVLTALAEDKHPLKVLAVSHPSLLAEIAAISDGRNPSAHDSEKSGSPNQLIAHAHNLAENTFDLVKMVLDMLNQVRR